MENEILSILKNMQGQMNGMESKIDGMESKIDGIESKMDGMESKMDGMESKIDEHTSILRALEHLAQVNKAEHDKMSHDIASIMGDVKSIKQDLAQVELVTASNWADIVRLKAVR